MMARKRNNLIPESSTAQEPPAAASESGMAQSWIDFLPTVTPAEIDRQMREAFVRKKLCPWLPLFVHRLPAAMSPWWPYLGQGEFALLLTLRDSDGTEREIHLHHTPVRIGRGESCHIQLPSPTVSTEHAEIRVDRGVVTLMDLKSTNRTRLNGVGLEPLTPVALRSGDRFEIGPYPFTFANAQRTETETPLLQIRGDAFRLVKEPRPFRLLAHPADRWMRVRWADSMAWVRVPIQWIKACWQRLTEIRFEDNWSLDALEEGVAQFILLQVAKVLSDQLQILVQVDSWMTGAEADRMMTGSQEWLQADVWLGFPPTELATTVLVPIGEMTVQSAAIDLTDLVWPASVCIGMIRLKVSDWKQVDPGDAMLPDLWTIQSWTEESSITPRVLGPATLKVGGFWHNGQLHMDAGRLTLALEKLWLRTPGGGLLMPEKETPVEEVESVPVNDLELQIVVELDRFPITVGELKRWQVGQCATLQRGPNDPVRLILETGFQRRVLAEGRIVMLSGKLGVEITRLLTQLQEGPK